MFDLYLIKCHDSAQTDLFGEYFDANFIDFRRFATLFIGG